MSAEVQVLMLQTRLRAMDDCRMIAEVVYRRSGREYSDAIHEERKAPVRAKIARFEATPGYDPDGYP